LPLDGLPNDDVGVSTKPTKKKRDGEPKAYLAKIKGGYLAIVEGYGDAEIKDNKTVKKIKKLLKARQKAGEQISDIIQDKGISTASVHHAAVVLGEEE